MTIWIAYIVVAQFLYSLVALLDKYIVTSKTVSRPIVYTFYIGLLSSTGILFFFFGFIKLPFGLALPLFSNVTVPTFSFAILSILLGYALIGGFYFLFTAFRDADTSDVVPVFQSVIAIFSFFLPFIFFGESLSKHFVFGFIFLVIGTILVSRFRLTKKILLQTVIAGILISIQIFLFDVLSNSDIYSFTNRDNAIFWTRIAVVIASLTLMLLPNCCGRTAKSDVKDTGKKGFALIIGNKLLAGIASFLIFTSIAIASSGDLPLVNALGGLQFLFLLIFALFFGHKTPYACGENCTRREKIQKVVSVFIIFIGFIILFI